MIISITRGLRNWTKVDYVIFARSLITAVQDSCLIPLIVLISLELPQQL